MNSKILSREICIDMRVDFSKDQFSKIVEGNYDCICNAQTPVLVNDAVVGIVEDSNNVDNDDGETIGFKLNLLIWNKFLDEFVGEDFGLELDFNPYDKSVEVASIYNIVN